MTVVGDRAYTQRQTLTTQSVVCLDAEAPASTIWEYGLRLAV